MGKNMRGNANTDRTTNVTTLQTKINAGFELTFYLTSM